MTDSSKPFGRDASGTPTVAAASGTSWVSVAELLAQQVPVQSSEAVAVLAELCAVLLGRGDDVIPHAADVLVNGEGTLSVRASDHGALDSGAPGRMLHSLLATGHTPATLRLFVSQAISSDRYQSISAFAEALAAYEVPGRNKLIQAVYYRWVVTRSAAVSSVPVPSLPEPEKEKKAAKPNAGARGISRLAIATVLVAVLLGGAGGAWFAAGAKPLAIPSVSWSVPSAIQKAWAWLEASKPGDTIAAAPEIRDPQRRRAAKPRRGAAGARASNPVLDSATANGTVETTSETGSVDGPVTADPSDAIPAGTDLVSDTAAPLAAAAFPPPSATGDRPGTLDGATTIADSRVYSSAFPDVKPPVMMPRQISPPEGLIPGREAPSTIELLVDEAGEVERVRLLSRPSPILATMLLSAAKTWKFKPALNDGRPVKYRLLLDVMTTRP